MLKLIHRLFVTPAPVLAAVPVATRKTRSTLVTLQRAAVMDMIRQERRK
jgi:hypothetical protein